MRLLQVLVGCFCLAAIGCPGPTPPNPPTPPPPPPPPPPPSEAPWDAPGLTVLILRESQDVGQLPVSQRAIFSSVEVHQWLTANTATLADDAPGYRIWDDDTADVANAPPVMQAAYVAVKSQMIDEDAPMLGVSTGRSGVITPLPLTVAALLDLLEGYK